jgi:hypothetical protein
LPTRIGPSMAMNLGASNSSAMTMPFGKKILSEEKPKIP